MSNHDIDSPAPTTATRNDTAHISSPHPSHSHSHTPHTTTAASDLLADIDTDNIEALLNDVKRNLSSNIACDKLLAQPHVRYQDATTAYSPNRTVVLTHDNMSSLGNEHAYRQHSSRHHADTSSPAHTTDTTQQTQKRKYSKRPKSTEILQPVPEMDQPVTYYQQSTPARSVPPPALQLTQYRTHEEAQRHKEIAVLYYKQAVEFAKKQQWYDAALQYSHALDEWSDDPRLWVGRAMCYYYLRPQPLLRLALLDMNEAITRVGDCADFYYRRACIYAAMEYSSSFNTNALVDLETCLVLQGDRADALTNRAAIYVRMNMLDQAKKDLDRAAELNGGDQVIKSNSEKLTQISAMGIGGTKEIADVAALLNGKDVAHNRVH